MNTSQDKGFVDQSPSANMDVERGNSSENGMERWYCSKNGHAM